jgi:succinate dehydrogenase / fumarate reductase cytochrome b subunit
MKINYYVYRKIHSLLGVIPIGAFLIEHLITNYEAHNNGHEAYVRAVEWLQSLPLVFFLELFGIWLPLLYHGVYGLYMAYQSRNNVTRYGYFRNWMFLLQRVTGVITFIFIVWHVFETRVQVALGNVEHTELGVLMHDLVQDPLVLTAYIIGLIAASFHFTNGLWSFLVSWGITVGPKSQKISTVVCMVLFVVMSVMFVQAITAFADPQFAELPQGV